MSAGGRRRGAQDLAVAVVALGLLLLWDASPLDMVLLQPFGDAQGFAWKQHWFTENVLHEGGRKAAWGVFALLAFNVWRPLWPAVPRAERWRWLLLTLLCALCVPLIKKASSTSCPWDLALYGGSAQHLSHWLWGVRDGGPGGCFPSGHAVSAFAFLSGWFALRGPHPRAACWWLAGVLLAGLVFGAAQMVRGAHFASHALWTAWLCWVICALGWAWPARAIQPAPQEAATRSGA